MKKYNRCSVRLLRKIISQTGEKGLWCASNEKFAKHDCIELTFPGRCCDVPEPKDRPVREIGNAVSDRRFSYRIQIYDETISSFHDRIRVFWGGSLIDELRVSFKLMAPYSKYFELLLKWGFDKDNPSTIDLRETFMQNVPREEADRQEKSFKKGFDNAIEFLSSGYMDVSDFDDCLVAITILDFLGVRDRDGSLQVCLDSLSHGCNQSVDRITKLLDSKSRMLRRIGEVWSSIYALVYWDSRYLSIVPEYLLNEYLFVMGFTYGKDMKFNIPEQFKTSSVICAALNREHQNEYSRFSVFDLPDELRTKSIYLNQLRHEKISLECFPEALRDDDFFSIIIAQMKEAWTSGNVTTESLRYDLDSSSSYIKIHYLPGLDVIPAVTQYFDVFIDAIDMWGVHAISKLSDEHIERLLAVKNKLENPNTILLLSNIEYVRDCLEYEDYLKCLPIKERTKDRCRVAVEVDPSSIHFVPDCHLDEEMGLKFLYGGGRYGELPEALRSRGEGLKAVADQLLYKKFGYISSQPISTLDRTQLEILLTYCPERLKTLEADNKNLDENLCRFVAQNEIFNVEYVPEKFKTEEFCLWAASHANITGSDDYVIRDMFPQQFDRDVWARLQQRGYESAVIVPPNDLLYAGGRPISRDECLEAVDRNPCLLDIIPEEHLDRLFVLEVLKRRKLKLNKRICTFIKMKYPKLGYGDQRNRRKMPFILDLIDAFEFSTI